jgi:hypothetical protein
MAPFILNRFHQTQIVILDLAQDLKDKPDPEIVDPALDSGHRPG